MFEKISSRPYLSGYTYRALASQAIPDVGDTKYMHDVSRGIVAENVRENDLLYVTGNRVKDFFQTIALDIEVPFRMITAQTDPGVDSLLANMMPNNITKWYSINVHVDDNRIIPIPLGLQNKHWRWDGNSQSCPTTYERVKSNEKENGVLASFSIGNRHEERRVCIDSSIKYIPKDKLTIRGFTPQNRKDDTFVLDYFDIASTHKFILCPWGVGVDTHRMWESMYMGCIPITRHHNCYRDFKDFPIIMLDSWLDLADLDFDAAWEEYSEKLKDEERIYFTYWEKKIND